MDEDENKESHPYNEEEYNAYLQQHSGEYETVLWSGNTNGIGGEDNARYICDRHNADLNDHPENYSEDEKEWKTNEMLLDDCNKETGMERPSAHTDNETPDESAKIDADWNSASEATAKHAEGNLHVIKGEDGRENSVYNDVERDAVADSKCNQDVDIVDPATMQSKGIESKDDLSPTMPSESQDEDNVQDYGISR